MFRTLIVEDNDWFQVLLKETLHSLFPTMEVTEAADGNKALQKIHSSTPNLVFMDIALPGENGLELTRKIKREYPDIIIIILTNHDQPEYRQAASEYGAEYFFPKDSLSVERISVLINLVLSDHQTHVG
jgi:DNA-binding NarL/FixJ family response regulator